MQIILLPRLISLSTYLCASQENRIAFFYLVCRSQLEKKRKIILLLSYTIHLVVVFFLFRASQSAAVSEVVSGSRQLQLAYPQFNETIQMFLHSLEAQEGDSEPV